MSGGNPDRSHGLVYGGRGVTLYVDLTADGLRIVDMEQFGITSGIRCLKNDEFDYWSSGQK